VAHIADALLNYAGQGARRANYQPPGRAWHPSGKADASGWAGLAVAELLVHGHDVARPR
jgi:hypothetical protein